jgi:adenosylcobinamide kinase / adenosylcobinamide-phosphate guanylyltransferase
MDGVITRIAMIKQITLVTGGARSGKSRYAEERAKQLGARLLYLATAEAKDEEMIQRIAEHQKRRGDQWITIEEPLELAEALLLYRGRADCAVVDCLTLWISNLLAQRDEAEVKKKVEELVARLPSLDFDVFLVTNEVGSAIVPDNPLARKFRDLMGWTNQRFAKAAHEVVLMVTGLPVIVRKEGACS